jgi:hypothetical protein
LILAALTRLWYTLPWQGSPLFIDMAGELFFLGNEKNGS